MRINRFFVQFNQNDLVIIINELDIVKQIKDVLRLKNDDQIILIDGNNNERLCKIVEIDKKFVKLNVLSSNVNENESSNDCILYCAILKRENFELVVQKAVELGVKEITPIITKRTIKLDLKEDRLKKIIKEAAEQSGRGVIPTLNKITKFDDVLIDTQKNKTNLLFDDSGIPIKMLKVDIVEKERIGIFIGPEGGWDENEVILAKNNGFKIANIGKLTLRAETAAIIASYIGTNI